MKVAFTGHREYDKRRDNVALEARIAQLCTDATRQGVKITFLSGMAVGFDMAAAEAVCDLRDENGLENVELHAIIPYAMQAEFFSESDLIRYQALVERADRVVVLEDEYSRGVFFKRNDYLVEHAKLLIAYFDGVNKGGTAYTVRQARKANLPTENIYPKEQLSLF